MWPPEKGPVFLAKESGIYISIYICIYLSIYLYIIDGWMVLIDGWKVIGLLGGPGTRSPARKLLQLPKRGRGQYKRFQR